MVSKKATAIIAVVVVIIVVVAAVAVILSTKPTTPPPPSVSLKVSESTVLSNVGQNVSFIAFVSGGTPTNVTFNFGDGIIVNSSYSSTIGGYPSSHVYKNPGRYLVTVSTVYQGYSFNNYANVSLITILPSSVSALVASEITQPTIISNQIFYANTSTNFVGSYLQPPTEQNWTLGYYVWNFGDSHSLIDPAIYNESSGLFLKDNVTHVYGKSGIYTLTLSIITFNSSKFTASEYNNNPNLIYYPVSEFNSIISSGQYQNTSYKSTILILYSGEYANISKSTLPIANPNEIIDAEYVPGGPYSLDPNIDYEMVGFEVISNVYETLIAYNGSSVTEFVPVVAKYVPTVANGGISPDGLNYTFYIRSGLKFSNGDPLTVYDAYTSFVRALLFMLGSPGTPDWILGQDLLPGGGWLPGAVSYQNITAAITYNNATQSITFHLLKPDPAFLTYMADALFPIMDYNWLVQNGAGITFTPAGFQSYINYSYESNYNTYIRWHAMGSGPYEIETMLLGQSITLVPNPNFTPIPGVPGYSKVPNNTVYIEWVKDPSTEYLMLTNQEADVYSCPGLLGLPYNWYPTASKLESEGKLSVYEFPSMTTGGFAFNFDINTTMMASFGSQFHVPPTYFQNLDVRRAFAYAFNYTDYIDQIVGNSVYGANFSFHTTGYIPYGMPGYESESLMKSLGVNVPYFNLTLAKEYMMESGMYNVSVNIPVVVYAGDPVDYAAASMWAQNMQIVDKNIVMTPIYTTFSQWIGYQVEGANPMPIYVTTWIPDYPYPSDIVGAFYAQGGTYPIGSGLNPDTFNSSGNTDEAAQIALMNQYIQMGENTANSTLSIHYYDLAQNIAVNLTFYVYARQLNWIWYFSPYLQGMQFEENPMIGGGGAILFFYLSK